MVFRVCVALGAPKTKVGNRLACSVVTMLSEVNLHGGTVKTVPYEQKLYCLRYPRAMPSPRGGDTPGWPLLPLCGNSPSGGPLAVDEVLYWQNLKSFRLSAAPSSVGFAASFPPEGGSLTKTFRFPRTNPFAPLLKGAVSEADRGIPILNPSTASGPPPFNKGRKGYGACGRGRPLPYE